MSNQHTPGPWRARKGAEDEPERWIIVADNGTRPYLIATIENGQPGDTLETEESTAHLIAAAHELLEALEAIVNCDVPLHFGLLGDARSAIAKATGKDPG